MYRALLWKEWREQRWKVAMGTMLVVAVLGGLLWSGVVPPTIATLLVLRVSSLVFPIVATLDVIVVERKNQTLGHLVALPLRPAHVCLIKCGVGCLTVLVPMLAAVALAATVVIVGPGTTRAAWVGQQSDFEGLLSSWGAIVGLLGAGAMWYLIAYGVSTDRPHEGEVFVTYVEILVISLLALVVFEVIPSAYSFYPGNPVWEPVARSVSLVVGLLNPLVVYQTASGGHPPVGMSPAVWWWLYAGAQTSSRVPSSRLSGCLRFRKLYGQP